MVPGAYPPCDTFRLATFNRSECQYGYVTLDDVADELYGLEPGEFVEARTHHVRTAREDNTAHWLRRSENFGSRPPWAGW